MDERECRIISRKEAIASGLTYYFSGRPCKSGHVAWRVLASRTCSICAANACSDQYYKDIETNRKKQRERIALDPASNRKKAAEWQRKYPERAAKRNKEWRLNNQPRVKQNRIAWNTKNPEKVTIGKATNRAKSKKVEGRYGVEDIRRIMKLQRGICVYCDADITKKHHVDHIIPMAKGGSNWPRNIQLCCPSCNLSKGARDPIKFAQEMGRLI